METAICPRPVVLSQNYRIEIDGYSKLDMFKSNEKSRWLKVEPIILESEYYSGEFDETDTKRVKEFCSYILSQTKNVERYRYARQLVRYLRRTIRDDINPPGEAFFLSRKDQAKVSKKRVWYHPIVFFDDLPGNKKVKKAV